MLLFGIQNAAEPRTISTRSIAIVDYFDIICMLEAIVFLVRKYDS